MNVFCKKGNCVHNDGEGSCLAKRIRIEGLEAQTKLGTSCATFSGQEDIYTVEFAADFMFDSEPTTSYKIINCEAVNCVYNSQGKCNAATVTIDEVNARCETFQLI